MMLRAAIVFIALATPGLAQHGGMRAGSAGSRGFATHAAFSAHAGMAHTGNYGRSASPFRYGVSTGPGFRPMREPNGSSFRIPYGGSRYAEGRSPFLSRNAGQSHGRDRDRFDARRRLFANWYLSTYPAWLGYGYPYTIDPGLFDWGDADDSADDQGNLYNQAGPPPDDPAANMEAPPYPNGDYDAPGAQAAAAPPIAPAAPEPGEPLTLIFKSGRAPLKVQNYMMTARVLTDLDPRHYEQIPLDQIDQAATRQANQAAGVDFQIPGASGD